MNKQPDRANVGKAPVPPVPRLRLKLSTAGDIAAELARLYREGKSGKREVNDISRLANVLQILNRIIETSELERRVALIEQIQQSEGGVS